MEICVCVGLKKAVFALLATYYIFNYSYASDMLNSLTYLQKYVFLLADNLKIPSRVTKLSNEVGKIRRKGQ